ncbi:MAG TPA: hypothetical protein VHX52_12030 [Steroidobacteraceae bacterium]|nr:hypothetical protein [Steroidobacteraceae bacterium]
MRIADGHVPDSIYETVRAQFSEAQLMNLTLALTNINAWNRLCIALRSVPGSYQPMRSSPPR